MSVIGYVVDCVMTHYERHGTEGVKGILSPEMTEKTIFFTFGVIYIFGIIRPSTNYYSSRYIGEMEIGGVTPPM